MLSFIRNITKSRIGLIAVFVLLGVIAIAFAASDITGSGTVGGGGSGAVVARVGDRKITESELADRVQIAADNLRRQGQDFSMAEFLENGGLDYALQQSIDNAALEEFARANGMQVSKRTVDGVIASNPAFQGPDGQFDQARFESLLAQERIGERALRDDLRASKYVSWMIDPTVGASQVATGMVLPYASLLLERRQGQIAFIPTLEMDPGEPPSDAQLTEYYNRHVSRYTVPERRVIRYALVNNERAAAEPTEAEIAQAYRAAGDRFAATEKRSLRQLVLGDQATATRIATAVKGGQTLQAAASGAGLETTSFDDVTKAELARQTSNGVADAAFAAAQGAVAGPVQSPLGWHVLHVESVEAVPARTLAEVRDQLASELRERKTVEAMVATYNTLDEGIGDGSTFDELLAETRLQAQKTPALLANGTNPDAPGTQPDQTLAPIVRAAFQAEQGGEPQLVPIDETSFALVTVDNVVPAAARPLDSIKDNVRRDYLIDKAQQKARDVARNVVAALNRGTGMRQALAAAGVPNLPPPQTVDTTRAQLAAAGRELPPPLRLMFSMAEGRARHHALAARCGAKHGGHSAAWCAPGDAATGPP